MKKIILLCLCLCSFIQGKSQVTDLKIDCQTPGWLSSMINYGDQQSIRNLTVTGYFNPTDFKFIGTLIENHNLHGRVDLYKVIIIDDNNKPSDYFPGFGTNSEHNKSVEYLSLPHCISKGGVHLTFYIDTLLFDTQIKTIERDNLSFTCNHFILGESIDSLMDYSLESVDFKSIHFPSNLKYIGEFVHWSGLSDYSNSNFRVFPSLERAGLFAFNDRYAYNNETLPDSMFFPKMVDFSMGSFEFKEGMHVFLGPNVSVIRANSDIAYSDYTNWTPNIKGVSLHIAAETPPTAQSWYGSSAWNKELTVYVPKGCASLYQNNNSWKQSHILEEFLPLKQITLDKHELLMDLQDEIHLTTSIYPENADSANIIWSVKDSNVAQVDSFGNVTALYSGKTIIYAISEYNPAIKDSCQITVKRHVDEVAIIPNSVEFNEIGESQQLTAIVLPEDATDKSVEWSSSNSDVCWVSSDGMAFAMSEGSAIITAKTVDGGYSAYCFVKVSVYNAIDDISVDVIHEFSTLTGQKISVEDFYKKKLPKGIYLIDGKKFLIK